MKQLIIFLICKHLKLRKYELFKFVNQKDNCSYYFNSEALIKMIPGQKKRLKYSEVSLNWLLNDKCKIRKV